MWIRYNDCFDIKFDTDIIMLLGSIWYLFKYIFLKHRPGKICMTSREHFIHYVYSKELWFHVFSVFYVYHIFITRYITHLGPTDIANSGVKSAHRDHVLLLRFDAVTRFIQLEHWTLRSHWLKGLRQRQTAVLKQGPAAECTLVPMTTTSCAMRL